MQLLGPCKNVKIAIITSHSASVVRTSCAGVNPTLRDELCCLVSPQERRPIDSPRRDVESRPFWDGLCEDGSVSNCNAHSDWDGREETENFVANCGEVGEGLEDTGEIDV
jgi:hypothetical protein